jgi:hypothetical protein
MVLLPDGFGVLVAVVVFSFRRTDLSGVEDDNSLWKMGATGREKCYASVGRISAPKTKA